MRRYLATAALALILGACATAQSDTLSRICDDYSYAVQAVSPLKAKLDPQVVKLVNTANAISAPLCAFGEAGDHFSAALADWAKASNA